MYDTAESNVQFCLQKPNVHTSTLLKDIYEVALTCPSIAPWDNNVDMIFRTFFKANEINKVLDKIYL